MLGGCKFRRGVGGLLLCLASLAFAQEDSNLGSHTEAPAPSGFSLPFFNNNKSPSLDSKTSLQGFASQMADQVLAMEKRMYALQKKMAATYPLRWKAIVEKCKNPSAPGYVLEIKKDRRGRTHKVYEPTKKTVTTLLGSLSDESKGQDALLGPYSSRSFYASVITAYYEARGLATAFKPGFLDNVGQFMTQLAPLAKGLSAAANPVQTVASLLEPESLSNMSRVIEIIRNRALNETADNQLDFLARIQAGKHPSAPEKVTPYDKALAERQFSMWNADSKEIRCDLIVPPSDPFSFRQAIMAFWAQTQEAYKGLGPDVINYVNNQCYSDAYARRKGEGWIKSYVPVPEKKGLTPMVFLQNKFREFTINTDYSQSLVTRMLQNRNDRSFLSLVQQKKTERGHVFLVEEL